MKKILVSCALGALFISPVFGVVKCVSRSVNGSSSCWAGEYVAGSYCSTGNVESIGVCAGPSDGKSFSNDTVKPSYSSALSENKTCWCRIISPYVTEWSTVMGTSNGTSYSTRDECLKKCGQDCSIYANGRCSNECVPIDG